MKKVGRPRKASDVSTETVAVRLTKVQREILDDYCANYQTNISDVIRGCLDVMCVVPRWNRLNTMKTQDGL